MRSPPPQPTARPQQRSEFSSLRPMRSLWSTLSLFSSPTAAHRMTGSARPRSRRLRQHPRPESSEGVLSASARFESGSTVLKQCFLTQTVPWPDSPAARVRHTRQTRLAEGFHTPPPRHRLRSWSTDIWETADSRSPRSPTATGSRTVRRWRTTPPRSACTPPSTRESPPSTPPTSTRTPSPNRSSAMHSRANDANLSRSSRRSTSPQDRRGTTTPACRAST